MSHVHLYEDATRKATISYTKKINERENSHTIPTTESITVHMIVWHSQAHGRIHLLYIQLGTGDFYRLAYVVRASLTLSNCLHRTCSVA